MARTHRIPTRPASRWDRRTARRRGRGDALASPTPAPAYVHLHRRDRTAFVRGGDKAFEKVASDSREIGVKRERALAAGRRHEADLVTFEPARAAAGPLRRVLVEQIITRAIVAVLALLDVSGGMIFMQRIQLPVGMSPNLVRWIGALAIGLAIAICPMLGMRSFEAVLHRGATPDERRADEGRRASAIRRAIGFFLIPITLVALIAYARATSAPGLGGAEFSALPGSALAISPLTWQAIALLGLTSILATAAIEHYLIARRPAFDAHWAVLVARFGASASNARVRQADRALNRQGARWSDTQVSEEHGVRALSTRNIVLHAEWATGGNPYVDHDLHITPSGFEIPHPAPMQVGLSEAAQTSVRGLEERAAQLAMTTDPFAVVIPRREMPQLLRAARQMIGISHPHGN
jgi:hypothetical protein